MKKRKVVKVKKSIGTLRDEAIEIKERDMEFWQISLIEAMARRANKIDVDKAKHEISIIKRELKLLRSIKVRE